MYALYIQALNQHIAELNPLLSPGVRQQRAAMIAAMIEGMMLMLEEADNDLKEGDAGIEMEMRIRSSVSQPIRKSPKFLIACPQFAFVHPFAKRAG